ncbi:sugar phosphate isomerase/epimerase [Kibdelosporangium philippinense]|uniref:Sugar phosphate isomerase/epimerase n=1 Tax=Kibdelosporangium philippinense TaxID=211113 RepID=A0ABS8Z7N9_9PSEU|nr:sugar phosphate isomerase/epimerase [Kibdelosporangium philippinense]MCE7003904.1 sugar phosphate isomerase/epimerase [Kibdelosporangium philippinense]
MTNVSVQLYSVRDHFTENPDEVLAKLAAIGFTQVEPYGLGEHAAKLVDGLTRNGLTAPTAHARLIDQDQRDIFAKAAECGVGVVVDPFVPAEKWQNKADIAATADALNAAARIAPEFGVRVGYHNHWWELESRIDGRSAFEGFAELLDPEIVLEVDTYWAAAGGENPTELLQRLGERVYAIHVKDGGLATDASGQVPAGQGSIAVTDVLSAAPKALRVVEFDKYDGDIYEGISASFAYLKGVEG